MPDALVIVALIVVALNELTRVAYAERQIDFFLSLPPVTRAIRAAAFVLLYAVLVLAAVEAF